MENFLDLSRENARSCIFPALLLFFLASLAPQIQQTTGHTVGLGLCLLNEWGNLLVGYCQVSPGTSHRPGLLLGIVEFVP